MMKKKRGVLLEYVLLMCSILPLVFASAYLVYSSDFGEYGASVVYLYQRIITIISLPIP